MRRFLFASILSLVLLVASNSGYAGDYAPQKAAGKFTVETAKLELKDAKRDREVPIKIYYPKEASNACPVIVFSHGLGGTRDGYEYLGNQWASHGYISIHVQHLGSDDGAWKGQANALQSLKTATLDIRNTINRPKDITFVVDELERLNEKDAKWKGKFDLKRLGMAGHSYGAFTTLAIGGQQFMIRGEAKTLADPRFKALLPMSSPIPARNRDEAFSAIKLPCLHMTGTKDTTPINETTAEERRIPFDKMPGPDNFLLNFEGGDHMVFAGRTGLKGDRSKDEVFQVLIKESSTAFWDAYLRGDESAKTWLKDGGFKGSLGKDGVFEVSAADKAKASAK